MAHPHRHEGINYVGRETFLITATTRDHIRVFEDIEFGREAIQLLFVAARSQKIAIPVCVYMPDHAHAVTVGTTATSDVREFAYEWKKSTGYAWSSRGKGPLWDRGYWDSHLRSGSPIAGFIEYCVLNPVRARLVEDPATYPLIASDQYTIEELVAFIRRPGQH